MIVLRTIDFALREGENMYFWLAWLAMLIAINLLALFTIHVDNTLSDANKGRPPYTRKKKVLIFVITNVGILAFAIVGFLVM